MGIHISNMEIEQSVNDFTRCRVELIPSGRRGMNLMYELRKANMDLEPFMQMAVDHHKSSKGNSWQPGNMLKCLEDEGAFSLQKGLAYEFAGFAGSNRVRLKEFPHTTFDRSRFEAVPGLVTYGDPGKGKTALGRHGAVKGSFSNGLLSELAGTMGLKVSAGTLIEDKLYVHGNTTRNVGLPVRRQRNGRKLVP